MILPTPESSQRILVADDEIDMLDLVGRALGKEGFAYDCVEDGEAALRAVAASAPDLTILDMMMPKMSGLEVCRVLRSQAKTARLPIIMISARSDEVDRIVAFEVGVDDYVTKPFSPRELMLRVKAILRPAQSGPSVGGVLTLGDICLNEQTRTVQVAGEEVAVTSLEYRMLRLFLAAPHRVHSREELLAKVWDQEGIEIRTIDTQVRRLRASLGRAAEQVETVRAFGYRLVDKAPAAGAM